MCRLLKNSFFKFKRLYSVADKYVAFDEQVLNLLDDEQAGGSVNSSEKSAKAETTSVQMPDLIDTGDPNDFFGTDDSTKNPSDQKIVNPTMPTTPLIDDLFGDSVGTSLSTGEQKTDDDPFADVSFHPSEGREHADDLFSGMTIDDKLASTENHMAINKNEPGLFDIFGSDSEFLQEQENLNTDVNDLMAGMSINENVSKIKPQGTSPGVLSESIFSDASSNPTHQISNDALKSIFGSQVTGMNTNPMFPSGAIPYNIPPGMMLNPAFLSQPINYGAMGSLLAHQQFLSTMSNFQHLSNLNAQSAGVNHAAGTGGDGFSSPFPDVFQSNFPNQAPSSMINSPKKEDTRAFDFISVTFMAPELSCFYVIFLFIIFLASP